MVHIFPTNRAVRSFYLAQSKKNQLLPKAYSIQSFFEYALHVKDKIRADNLIRTLCMQEAIDFDAFEELHIPRNFMAFVKHEDYLFRFFEELSAEEVNFDALKNADTYALYDEHLTILKTVYERYVKALEARGYYDLITLRKNYTLDNEFIVATKEITLHHEGYLSNFELRVFSEISKIVPLHVKMVATQFNSTETKRLFNLTCSKPKAISGLLFAKEFKKRDLDVDLKVKVAPFNQRNLQVGFVFDQIARFVNDGLDPENIVVVLPDESFATTLRMYDKNRVLNFAMGISVTTTFLYKKWHANYTFLKQQNQENRHRQDRYGSMPSWQDWWNKRVDFKQFLKLFDDYELASKPLKELLEKEFSRFKRLFDWQKNLLFKDGVELFLHELAKQSLDDVNGGPVTVLGLLETRGVHFDGVIIVDFNDSLIPKKSQKDWFLSSSLRAHAGLPDSQARENLQRHYYYRLLMQASHKALSYVQNEQSMPSSFLHSFEQIRLEYNPSFLAASFMPKRVEISKTNLDFSQKHDLLSYPISASRLKTLLTCKRRYYYQYIQKLEDVKLPHDGLDSLDIGTAIHSAFEKLYTTLDEDVLTNKRVWKNRIKSYLKTTLEPSLHWELESGIWENRFNKICDIEISRFKEGWRPWKLEESITCKFHQFTLHGRIDRIDRHEDGRLEVLDYKTGTILQSGPKTLQNRIDFQLVFYHILASTLGSVYNVGYYDLNQGRIVHENNMESLKDRLLEALEENRIIFDFEKTSKQSHCNRCPFARLCQRKSQWS